MDTSHGRFQQQPDGSLVRSEKQHSTAVWRVCMHLAWLVGLGNVVCSRRPTPSASPPTLTYHQPTHPAGVACFPSSGWARFQLARGPPHSAVLLEARITLALSPLSQSPVCSSRDVCGSAAAAVQLQCSSSSAAATSVQQRQQCSSGGSDTAAAVQQQCSICGCSSSRQGVVNQPALAGSQIVNPLPPSSTQHNLKHRVPTPLSSAHQVPGYTAVSLQVISSTALTPTHIQHITSVLHVCRVGCIINVTHILS